jgi:hypothetical protein
MTKLVFHSITGFPLARNSTVLENIWKRIVGYGMMMIGESGAVPERMLITGFPKKGNINERIYQ